MKHLANRIVAAFSSSETPVDATDVLIGDESPIHLPLAESSLQPRQPKRLVKRTQFGSQRIPKKFRYFLKRSYPMYVDEPEESISYLPPKLTKTE
jgi:hypothetical protein